MSDQLTTRASGDPDEGSLHAENITVRFGGLTAVSDVSVRVDRGTTVGLLGPNGAGKTTLFAVLSGLLRPNAGSVSLLGRDVTTASPQARARLGLARTFQQPELFLGLSVGNHFRLAYRVKHARSRLWKDVFTPGSLRRPDRAEAERVDSLLQMLSLSDLADTQVDVLPLGLARLVEVGRALALSPAFILLDEPFSGLDAHESERLATALIQARSEENVGLMLVEHDVEMVLRISSRLYVLDFGQLIAEGPAEQVRNDPRVQAAYLGDADIALGADTEEASVHG